MSIIIKNAVEGDIPDLARIHLASKLAAEAGIVDSEFLNAKTIEEYEEKWVGFYADEDSTKALIYDGETAVGFVSFGPLRTPPAGMSKIRPLYSSEIFAIYVEPEYFDKGYGKKLLQYAVTQLKEQKHKSLCLWALDKNKRACGFYEKMGGQRVGKQIVEMGPSKVKEACYGWRNIDEIMNK